MLTTEFLADSGWFDSHCHLNDIPELDAQLTDAAKHQIQTFVIPGTCPKQWQQILPMESDQVHVALGIHPWYITQPQIDLATLKEFLISYKPVAIGEIGLDFYQGSQQRPSKHIQIEVFEEQLCIAKEQGLPVILHSVKAHNDVLRILKRMGIHNGVVHAFSGSVEMAQLFIDQGFHLGVGPSILKSPKTLNAISNMPIERLLLETDAPFMKVPSTDSTNPLLDLILVAEQVAIQKNMPLIDVKMQTRTNGLHFFSLERVC